MGNIRATDRVTSENILSSFDQQKLIVMLKWSFVKFYIKVIHKLAVIEKTR